MEVGRSKTLSVAARQLGVDDSTVSRRIAQLEYSLGEAVFARDHLGFHLTPRGKELLGYVEEMESGALAVAEAMGGNRRDPSGKVRVATMEGIASLYLSGQFVDLHRRHPALEIELVTSANLVHVNRREADIFLSFFPFEGRGLQVAPVGEFQLHLYASPEYLKARGTPERREALDEHVFCSYVDDLVQLDTVRWLNEAVPNPAVVFHSTSMLAQMFAAVAGGGLVMLPTFARAERFGLVPVLPAEVVVKRVVWLTVHKDLQYTTRIKATIAFLEDALKRDFPLPPDAKPL
jgi:DNA-binding transcriptional LysR family regulator